MSDLFEGQTMTEAYKFISAGAAHTFTFNFQPDKVTFYNLTDWTGTAAGLPISVWFRDLTTDTDAYQQQVIDSSAGASFNFVLEGTNGFTVANTTGGQAETRTVITAITAANPCVVTAVAHGLQTGQLVRITDLGADMPTARGMDELNGNRYAVTVLTADTFSLQDAITGEDINSTAFVAYVIGGSVNLITHTLDYSTQFAYDPIEYKLTAGTAVMGTNDDQFLIEVVKYGRVVELGDLA